LTGESPRNPFAAFLRSACFLDPSIRAELEALIDDLGLESLGLEKVEVDEGEAKTSENGRTFSGGGPKK
jgi:hypothetical protein